MAAERRRLSAVLSIASAAGLGPAVFLYLESARAAPSVGNLQIEAVGFASAKGHAEAKLFRHRENVLAEPFKRLRVVPNARRANFVFSDLPYGDYAVVIFHDENDNGKTDHNFLGLPAEPLGFSNGFSPGLFTGMPTFEKLRFAFRPNPRLLHIRVK